jgi:predicted amidohydrolase
VFKVLKIALCQTNVVADKKINTNNAYKMIREAASKGAKIVALGEMFNCPYSGKYFFDYAEEESNSTTVEILKNASREYGIYIIGGSIPEFFDGKVYNTSYVLSPDGGIDAKYRKIHLFDVDIKNGIRFIESDYLTPGESITLFDTIYGRIGLCICYDIRFPELVRSMALKGAQLIFVPAAFNMTTGPAHWELLFRARALDNQVYLAGISPARDYAGVYTAYGHSIITNPWGQVIGEAGEKQEIIYAEIDLDYEEKVRQELPLLKHRKPGIYIY